MTMRRIVVVGNGIAGLTACDSLRSAGFDGELTVVGAERHHPYSRPALSKALLHGVDGHGDEGLQAHQLPEPTHEATELLGVSVSGLDVDARVVRLDGGDELPYDGLVIASGSRAKRLAPTEGAREPRDDGSARELTLRTIEDAITLRQRVAATPVGHRGRRRTARHGGRVRVPAGWLRRHARLRRPAPLAPAGRAFVRDLHHRRCPARAAGRWRREGPSASTPVPGRGSPWPTALELEADLVVTAIGDEPNIGWLAGSNLLVDGSLRVDTRGRLRPEIVAAGDVAFFPTSRGVQRVPLWTSAIDQAKVAAVGLLHGDAAPELDFQPYFWTEGFGLSLKSVGFTPVAGAPDYCEQGKDPESMLLRWENRDGSGTAAAVELPDPHPEAAPAGRRRPGALRPAAPVNA